MRIADSVLFPRATRRAGPAVALAVTVLVPWLTVAAAASAPPEPASPERQSLFAYDDPRITESSGLAVSTRHDGVVYTHNDSGGRPALYAVGPDGVTRAVLTLRGAAARDWEALATGRDGTLWVGDIGDNGGWWREIRVYRVHEPAVLRDAEVGWARYRLRYADGARNAEALLVDPRTGRLYVVSKQDSGAGIYAAPSQLRTDGVNLLRRIADAPAQVTDGAFLPDGEHVVLRGYFSATVLDRRWRTVTSLALPLQQQGESLAATRDGTAILAGSEGRHTEVWRVPLPRALAFRSVAPATRDTTGTPASSTPPPSAAAQRPIRTTTLVGVLSGLVLLAGLVIRNRRRNIRPPWSR
jgi:hypothetical protein